VDIGLKEFEDLKVGQKVEVDFEYREGKHFANEVELEIDNVRRERSWVG
jgi:cold shock CspA family protein